MELCPKCHGDGTIRLPNGVKTCEECDGLGTATEAKVRRLESENRRLRAALEEIAYERCTRCESTEIAKEALSGTRTGPDTK